MDTIENAENTVDRYKENSPAYARMMVKKYHRTGNKTMEAYWAETLEYIIRLTK